MILLDQLTRQVAGYMLGWEADCHGRDTDLVRPVDGARLCIRWSNRAHHRIAVSGSYPASVTAGGRDHPEIGVSVTRGPRAIAHDIQRRLLPDVNRLHAKALQQLKEDQANRERKRAVAAELASILQSDVARHSWDDRPTVKWFNGDGMITFVVSETGESVFTQGPTSLPADLALRIARVIRQYEDEAGASPG